jgi:hypothetical protein
MENDRSDKTLEMKEDVANYMNMIGLLLSLVPVDVFCLFFFVCCCNVK